MKNIMLQNYKKPILIVLVVLLTVILVVGIILHFSAPWLSQSQKDAIELAMHQKILWDSSWDGAKTNALQYVGTYGDCVALLQYRHNSDAIGQYIEPPVQIDRDFFSRPVYLHNNAYIIFYNLKEQKLQTAAGLVERDIKWLTDEQKEQLARDIEKIGKKFS